MYTFALVFLISIILNCLFIKIENYCVQNKSKKASSAECIWCLERIVQELGCNVEVSSCDGVPTACVEINGIDVNLISKEEGLYAMVGSQTYLKAKNQSFEEFAKCIKFVCD